MNSAASRWKTAALLLLLTFAAILIHGYHPAVEDSNIYLTAIKKTLHPELYPFNNGFFASHAKMTLFPRIIAAIVTVTHIPLDWCMLLLHVGSIWLLLYAAWRLGRMLFGDRASSAEPWAGAIMTAALLTIPIAGTALYLMDEYFNPRSVATPLVLLLIVDSYERRWARCAIWAVLAGIVHPLMIVFGVCFVVLSMLLEKFCVVRAPAVSAAAVLLLGPMSMFAPASEAYREVLRGNSYFFLQKWEWYEWLGAIGPLALLWWYRQIALKNGRPLLARVCRDLIAFGAIFTVGGLAISLPARFAGLTLLQPMRAFQLIYAAFLVISAGLLVEYVLKNKAWRWAVVFLPLCGAMYYKQRDIFPGTPQLELPGRAPHNDWLEAFAWIRQNTPVDAYFALPPNYTELPGEDVHSFRALSERSALADSIKDRSAMTMFPEMAETWVRQSRAQAGWKDFQVADLERLKAEFGVNWVLLAGRPPEGLACPYRNRSVAVCRLP